MTYALLSAQPMHMWEPVGVKAMQLMTVPVCSPPDAAGECSSASRLKGLAKAPSV